MRKSSLYLLTFLILTPYPSFSLDQRATCILKAFKLNTNCRLTRKNRTAKKQDQAKVGKICYEKARKSFYHCLRFKKPKACKRLIRRNKRLKLTAIKPSLVNCAETFEKELAQCKTKVIHKKKSARRRLYSACRQKAIHKFRPCVKKNNTPLRYIPPDMKPMIYDYEDNCKKAALISKKDALYKKRLHVSKAIHQYSKVLRTLEKRLEAKQKIKTINSFKALNIKPSPLPKTLSRAEIIKGHLVLHFNRLITGKPFTLAIWPYSDMNHEIEEWRCKVTGKPSPSILPEICASNKII